MRALLGRVWERLHASYWFVPMLMVLGIAALGVFAVRLDRAYETTAMTGLSLLYGGSADGAQQLLATLAGAMITTAAMAFSVLIVVLSLASQQFGPRLLRNFMADLGNQLVLGLFISTYVYCVIALSRVYTGQEGGGFVPRIATTFALLLGVVSFATLIYFVHHMATSVRVDHIVERVSQELRDEIESLYPGELGQESEDGAEGATPPPEESRENTRSISVGESGYVETIDLESLMKLATENDLLVRLLKRPGNYLVSRAEVMLVQPGSRVNDRIARKLAATVSVSKYRTPTQDVEFSVSQLVEVAVRALSPSINDPFTAITCVDELGEALLRLAQRPMPSPLRYDKHKKVRVIAHAYTFSGISKAMYAQIRQASHGNVAVSMRLLESIGSLGPFLRRDTDRDDLLHHAEMIRNQVLRETAEPSDLGDLERRYAETLTALTGRVP